MAKLDSAGANMGVLSLPGEGPIDEGPSVTSDTDRFNYAYLNKPN